MDRLFLIELAKLAIQAFYRLSEMAQMNAEQTEALFQEEYKKLRDRVPADLPDA